MKSSILVSAAFFLLALAWVDDPSAAENKSSTLPKVVPARFTDKTTGMEFVLVKGGCFPMGDTFGDGGQDEKPVHEVCVKDFYLGKYEVTNDQWQRVMGTNPSQFKDCGPDCPVDFVSWDMAQDFISALNKMSKERYRLPTEAEWEYASRSGGKNEKWAGTSDEATLDEFAWFASNSGGKTHKVGQKKPNGLGLYDMTSNVREWCQDWYNVKFYASSPKSGPVEEKSGDGKRVTRGGEWERPAAEIRSSSRNKNEPDLQTSLDGLRLLLPVK